MSTSILSENFNFMVIVLGVVTSATNMSAPLKRPRSAIFFFKLSRVLSSILLIEDMYKVLLRPFITVVIPEKYSFINSYGFYPEYCLHLN